MDRGPVSQKSPNSVFVPISGATIPFISAQRRGSQPSNWAILLVFLTKKQQQINPKKNAKKSALRIRTVLGTFEKQAPDYVTLISWTIGLVKKKSHTKAMITSACFRAWGGTHKYFILSIQYYESLSISGPLDKVELVKLVFYWLLLFCGTNKSRFLLIII